MCTTKTATAPEELTEEQQAAYDDITERLEGGERFTALLGYAGTGKTYLAGHLAAAFTEAGRSVTCCAPTHKAAQVLRQKIAPAGGSEGIPVCTLHALLGLRLVPDGRGDYHLAPEPRRAGDLYADLVIVDEASMVGAEEWAFVEQTAPHVQWLFVGDPAQLPPVGEGPSPALAQPGVALEAVCRQQTGSPILALATEVRTGAALGSGAASLEAAFDGDAFDGDAGVATTRSRAAFTQSAVRAFGEAAFQQDAAHARLLAYRNRTVRRYNAAIRAALHGADAPRFQKGEWLVARETWLFDGMPQLFNSEEVRVRKAKEDQAESEDRQTWRVWRLTVRGAHGGRTRGLEVLHEDETARFREELERRKQAALKRPERWKAFYALKERFAAVDYAYAMTVHKSQGSTFDTAFVDAGDLAACRGVERQALGYVAVTRPARRLALLV